jgi:Zn-dependent protease with chaperone function
MPSLVHPKEKLYFALALCVSLFAYLGLGIMAFASMESLLGLAFYAVLGFGIAFFAKAFFLGHIRGNAVRVSERQFPEIDQSAKRIAAAMGLTSLPAIYVVQSGGILNAFATRFLGRSFVILYSEIVELALEQGREELDFIVCHELGHLHRKHLAWRTFLFPANIIPFLGAAYSRGCEYTCDRYGAYFVPKGAATGILVLATGNRLFRSVNLQAFEEQVHTETGLWVWYAEKLSTHPNLPKRVLAISEFLSTADPLAISAAATN